MSTMPFVGFYVKRRPMAPGLGFSVPGSHVVKLSPSAGVQVEPIPEARSASNDQDNARQKETSVSLRHSENYTVS